MLHSLLKKKVYALLTFYSSKDTQEGKREYIWSIYKNRCKIYLGVKPPSGSKDQVFIAVRQLRGCWCEAPPLTRGRVCHLQLLLALSSSVILRSSPETLMNIFYCLRLETPPTLKSRALYLYPPGTGWPSYTLRHGARFDAVHRLGFIEILYSVQSYWNQWSVCATEAVGLLTLRKKHEHRSRFLYPGGRGVKRRNSAVVVYELEHGSSILVTFLIINIMCCLFILNYDMRRLEIKFFCVCIFRILLEMLGSVFA
jgi:hypothetical protein